MPAQLTFTPLSEADLSEMFQDDPDGLRRYRLLHAVLVDSQLHIGKLANRCTWRAVRVEMMGVADTLLAESLHEVA
ncbi:hypothetical protein SE17_40510 [Kouleothrix aurantiaca]|uniref:Uncharacterized protein n=1 Tax=Kouleothrix aurantiaca TaxID=186479 RepID=A0A0P9CPN9_9CHLR|nr:hypothetical protein SE17_40510 [Kouleothrix aurantiaca]